MSKPSRLALPLGITSQLVALRAGTLEIQADAAGGRTLPDRLLAMPWGVTDTNKGRLIVNELTLSALPKLQAAAKFDRVAFDFEHATVNAKPGDEPIKVAGYGTPEIVEGEGIYLSAIEYTEDGKAALLGGHYPDLSPTLHVNGKGEVIFMHSLAACRHGEVDGLTLFNPTAGTPAADAMKLLSAGYESILGETPDFRAVAIAALNAAGASLDDDSDASAILAAAATLRDAGKKTDSPDPTNPQSVITMSADTLKPFEDRLAALEKGSADQRRTVILSAAKAAGKVIPLSAETIAATAPEVLEEIVSKLPGGTVPLASDTPDEVEEVSLSAGGLTADEIKAAKLVGLSADEMKKFGKQVTA
jgi:phage I-like protein